MDYGSHAREFTTAADIAAGGAEGIRALDTQLGRQRFRQAAGGGAGTSSSLSLHARIVPHSRRTQVAGLLVERDLRSMIGHGRV